MRRTEDQWRRYAADMFLADLKAPIVTAFVMGAQEAEKLSAEQELLDALKYVMSAHGEQLHDAFDQAHRAIAKAEDTTP